MDALTRLLDGPRSSGAYLLRARLAPPWCVELRDEAPVGVVAVLAGTVRLATADGTHAVAGPGEVAVLRGPGPFVLGEGRGVPEVVVHPGLRCTDRSGADVTEAMTLGPRLWGTDPDGPTDLVLGCYQLRGEVSRQLLAALPEVLVVRQADVEPPLVPVLAAQLAHEGPGQEAVLDRLFDLVFAAVLRTWFEQDDGPAAWYRAYGDAVAAQALRLVHDRPAHPWTVAGLAGACGVSRATLAQRFADAVGQSPMAYLTRWRLALAADRILDPRTTLESVAREVGYGSGFALSAAFKRERGISPREHRALVAAEDR